MRRSLILVAVLATLAGGCRDAPPETGVAAGARHNAADVAFARALLPHHRAGIALAAAAAGKQPAAKTLAEAIIVTQQDEMVRMTSWLGEWGAPVPAASTPAAPLKGDPVKALIAQQAGAIKIAQQEQSGGSNPAALDFARQIVESRTAQIEQLDALAA